MTFYDNFLVRPSIQSHGNEHFRLGESMLHVVTKYYIINNQGIRAHRHAICHTIPYEQSISDRNE